MKDYIAQNINASFIIGMKTFTVDKFLNYLNDIVDSKIKNKKEAGKEYLDRPNDDRELLYSIKNRDRNYGMWFDLYDDVKDAVFGKFK